MDVVIRTDGSCLNNGQPNAKGGCAIVVYDMNTGSMLYRRIFKPKTESITNNRCEAIAINDALNFVAMHENIRALIQSDSKTIVDGITGIAQRKANRDLWEPIEEIIPKIHNRILGVEHIASEDNKDADFYAFQAANALYIKEEGEWLCNG